MNILEVLIKLRDDLKLWATNNFLALKEEVDNKFVDYITQEELNEILEDLDVNIDLTEYAKLVDLNGLFDDVALNEQETTDSQTAIDFYSNGEVVKTVYFSNSSNVDLSDYAKKTDLDSSIGELEKIETSDTEPANSNVSVWINTSEDTPTNALARINDNATASDTTWSSEKIYTSMLNMQIGRGNSGNTDTVDNFHIVKLTQSQYNALSTKDSNTLYFIVG